MSNARRQKMINNGSIIIIDAYKTEKFISMGWKIYSDETIPKIDESADLTETTDEDETQ